MNAVDAFIEAERKLFERHGLTVQSRIVDLSAPALRVRVLEAGQGEPLLLVHGGGAFAAEWTPLMAHLDGWRLIAVDRPGCGLTDGFDYRGLTDFRGHAVSFLRSLLDALGIEAAPVVANSMGGLWSLWLALDHPERVSSLALLGCPALMPGTSMPFPMRLLRVPGLNRLMMALEPPSDPDRVPADVTACGAAAGRLPTFATGWLSLLERVLTLRGGRSDVRLSWDELRRVRQPVLLLWGDNDPFGGIELGRRACEVLPDANLKVVPGGHLPWLDNPAWCANSVEAFLVKHQKWPHESG